MKKVALYARTANAAQPEFHEEQKEKLFSYAQSVLKTDELVVYEDVCSALGSRPSFEKMKEDIRSGLISHVVARDVSRISRTLPGWVEFFNFSKRHGVEIYILNMSQEPGSDFGSFFSEGAVSIIASLLGDDLP